MSNDNPTLTPETAAFSGSPQPPERDWAKTAFWMVAGLIGGAFMVLLGVLTINQVISTSPAPAPVEVTQLAEPTPPPAPAAETVAEVAPAPEMAAPPTCTTQVMDQSTLWGISRRLLGTGKRWTEIRDLNPDVNLNTLQVGQTLNMPPEACQDPPVKVAKTKTVSHPAPAPIVEIVVADPEPTPEPTPAPKLEIPTPEPVVQAPPPAPLESVNLVDDEQRKLAMSYRSEFIKLIERMSRSTAFIDDLLIINDVVIPKLNEVVTNNTLPYTDAAENLATARGFLSHYQGREFQAALLYTGTWIRNPILRKAFGSSEKKKSEGDIGRAPIPLTDGT